MRSLKHLVLILALLTATAEANAVSVGKFYSLSEIKEFTISYDPKADIGLGSDLRLNVKAQLKNGKLKPFTKWSKVSVEVQGGKKIRLSGKDYLRVASDLGQIEDHKVHISITLNGKPEIQGSATIPLNYRGETQASFDGKAGSQGIKGFNGGGWFQWHGSDGGDGSPGRDGAPGQDLVVHIRRDPGSVDGRQLVRVTARTGDSEREYLFNAAGGSLLVSANGGSGGKGGNGGSGGHGNNGKMDGDRYKPPGRGGNAGSGSYGGNGGTGGNITVFLHPDFRSLYEEGAIAFSAAPGAPGARGKAGKRGRGGSGNRSNGSNRAGQNGARGHDGRSGQAGSSGSISVNFQETPDWTSLVQRPEADAQPGDPSDSSAVFAAGQVWSGQYVCGQGKTDLVLRINQVEGLRVAGVFEFAVSAQITGSFHIQGEWEPALRRIAFQTGDWISQPAGYTQVGLMGHVDRSGGVIAGVVDGRGCNSFAVTKFSD